MDIKHESQENKGRFYIEVNGGLAGEMTYSKAGNDKIIIDHTEVNEKFKGQKIGLQLVEASVVYAREHNIKIMPLCPFAKKMFERHAEFNDVLW